MAAYVWTGKHSGSWGDLANWSVGGNPATHLPTAADDVSIGVAGITVTIGTGVTAAAHSLNLVNSTLDITGGSLYTVHLATFNGAYVQTGGTYMMSGLGANFFDGFTQTGGTINVLSGAMQLYDGGTLRGTLTGTGALDIVNGSAYVNKGFACSLSSIVIGAQGGKLGFDINFTYAENLTLLSAGVLDLFGNTLTLSGTSLLEGVVGFGRIIDSGTMTLSTPQFESVLDNGLTLTVTGTLIQGGNVALGATDAGAKVNIAKSGSYQINGNWTTFNPSSVGSIVNAGVFAKTFGGKTARVDASLTSKGTIKTEIGTLLLNGLVNSIAGTVSGDGTLGIAGGQTVFGNKLSLQMAALDQQSGILVLNKAMTYAGEWDQTGGVLNLNATAAVLTLNGQTDLDGGTLTSFGGTMVLNGPAHAGNVTIGGPTTLDINGTLDQASNITFGLSSNPTATIAGGANWVLEGDSSILGFFGVIENGGTFIDRDGSGDSVVQSQMISTGTIAVGNSTLTLAGSNDLAGTLGGNGLLELAGSTELESGLVISVSGLTVDNSFVQLAGTLSYGHAFAEVGGGANLDLAGNTLALATTSTASLDAGLLSDGGALSAAGATVVGNFNVGGNADLIIAASGIAEQIGQLNLSPGLIGPGTLTVAAGGSYTLDDDVSIVGAGSVIIGGTFAAAGNGLSQISAFVSQTGTLLVNDQTLQLGGGGQFGGTIGGAGTVQFASFSGFSTYTLMGLSFAAAGWTVSQNAIVQLGANVAYGGLFQESAGSTIALSGHNLTLSGTASIAGGLISGAGTLVSSGSGTFANLSVASGGVLDVTGSAEQNATMQLGDGSTTGTLLIAAGGSYTLNVSSSIVGNGTLSVAGVLTAASNGLSQIGAAIVDTGTIAANLGTLSVLHAVGGSGAFSIGTSGLLDFSSTSSITASNTISFSVGGGHLEIDNPAGFAAVLAHFGSGDVIDLPTFDPATITGAFSAGNTKLALSDGRGDTATLTFATAQTPSAFSFGPDPAHGNVAAIFHS